MEVILLAIESVVTATVNLQLNAGVNQTTGRTISRTITAGRLDFGADGAKIMAVVGTMMPLLKYPIMRIQRRVVTQLEN